MKGPTLKLLIFQSIIENFEAIIRQCWGHIRAYMNPKMTPSRLKMIQDGLNMAQVDNKSSQTYKTTSKGTSYTQNIDFP